MASVIDKDFTVAIIGGGMCGLACAIGLAQAGIKANLFEAAAKFDAVGAGVMLGPNAVRSLSSLNLLDPVLKIVNVADANHEGFRHIGGTGGHKFIYDMPSIEADSDALRGFGIYRPTFLATLTPLIDPNAIFFGKRLSTITTLESGKHRLSFTDNTTYDVDLVIGADGIKSTVRNVVIKSGAANDCVKFANTYAYRGMVPVSALKAAGVKTEVELRPYLWAGFEKHMVTYPIQKSTVVNIAAMARTEKMGAPLSPEAPSPWVQTVDQQELLDAFQDWGDDATKILKHITQTSRWALHTLHPPLKSYVNNRVVLVGDAAHAMLPYIGAGVGQGLEDVHVLCRLLAHVYTRKETLHTVLSVYDSMRRPRANLILEQSLIAADIAQDYEEGKDDSEAMRAKLAEKYSSRWYQDLLYVDLEAEIFKALQSL